MLRSVLRGVLTAVAAVTLAGRADAQIVFNAAGSSTTNFDGLASSAGPVTWTNNSTVAGFFAFRSSDTAAVPTYGTSSGNTTTGGLYSFGSANAADRALGSIASGGPANLAYGAVVQNTSAEPLVISLAYDGEQWRTGGNTTQHTLAVSQRVTAALPTAATDWAPGTAVPGGYTAVPALTFTGPIATASATELDGNLAANRQVIANSTVATINPNEYLTIRWFDPNDAGNDHGLGIDNVVITATPVPEPATVLGVVAVGLGLARAARRRRAA